MKVCVECNWFKASNFSEIKFHECLHPECRHPVSGRPQHCVEMRKRGAPCGKDAEQHSPIEISLIRRKK